MKKKAVRAKCEYCWLVIEWNKTYREWDRVTPNKYHKDPRAQRIVCALSGSERHDPAPYAIL